MKLDKNKVVVGLSGGVDSSAAAYLLKQKGFEVIGLTMKLFDDNIDSTIEDAQKVAIALDIPHYIVDLRKDFKSSVIDNFVSDYLSGKTPNPCVLCNKYIKYGKFIEAAHNFGAYYIATGHYIDLRYDDVSNEYKIYKHKINTKDQTYLMYSITQQKLKHLIYPLGEFSSKQQVRDLVKNVDFNIYKKKDSVGICFIKDKKHGLYIQRHYKDNVKKGKFVDVQGNVIGEHKGIFNYTIGQRRGLGHTFNEPIYVVDIDYDKNQIVLGANELTYANGIVATDVNFISNKKIDHAIEIEVKLCQWGYSIPAIVTKDTENQITVTFNEKQRAPAIGQSVVLYKNSELIGGGKIISVIK